MPVTLVRSLHEHLNALEPDGLGYRIDARRAPGAAVRQAMEYRELILLEALKPAGHEAAARHVGVLMTCLTTVDKPDDVAQIIVNGFVDALADCPAGPLEQAASMFRTGKAGDGKWCPQAGEVSRLARKLALPLEAELADLRKVLNAKPVAREDAAVSKARAREIADETIRILKNATAANEVGRYAPPKTEGRATETPLEALERLKSQPLPKLSPEALATLGIKPPPSREDAA